MAVVNYTNEYKRLRSAVMYVPSLDEIEQKNTANAMYLSSPNPFKVIDECKNVISKLKSLKVEVIELSQVSGQPKTNNMIYLRDVAFVFRNKIFLGFPKHSIRSSEPLKFYDLIKDKAPDIARKIVLNDKRQMEGADLLVDGPNNILIYEEGRTSPKIRELINGEFEDVEYSNVPAKITNVPQHLLGAMHIIDKDLYCTRNKICKFNDNKKCLIKFNESYEIVDKLAMNIITIGPREILMPSGCSNTKKEFEKWGIVCHETEITEINKMGGGLACMMLPLERKE